MLIVLDYQNYKEYNQLISLICRCSLQEVEDLILYNNNDYDIINKLKPTYDRMQDHFGDLECDIVIITGNMAKNLLNQKSIFGCTIISDEKIICLIIWYNNIEVLKRVMTHELCHVYRIGYNNIKSDILYIKYLNNVRNQFFEELLAVMTEKIMFPNLSLEDIVEYSNNVNFIHYSDNYSKLHIKSIEEVDELLNFYSNKDSGFIYFLSYYFMKYYDNIINKYATLINNNSTEGIKSIIFNQSI